MSTRSERAAKRAKTDSVHTKARGPHPMYPERFAVEDAKVPWSVSFPEYKPVAFTHPVVLANDCTVKSGGWADPADVSQISEPAWRERISYEGQLTRATGLPINPQGRTGMAERGLLGKWGPNHAADPIVTRHDPERPGVLQMVAIKRRDTGDWAIPGGMVDPGEHVSVTVKREFTEEAGNVTDPAQKARFEQHVSALFAAGHVVYQGYVDDPRNTDNAWMETTAYHFHCNAELGAMLPLASGDDAAAVMWLDIDVNNAEYANLYASHRQWVDEVASSFATTT